MTLVSGLAVRETTRGPSLRDRNSYTPGWIEAPSDEVWWNGNAAAAGTVVTVTGSQTLTEAVYPRPQVAVTSIASISANDFNCLLFPRTISTGQTWACLIRNQTTTTNAFLMSCLVFTDGTSSTSNVVSSMGYQNTNGAFHHGCWNGTLTNVNTATGETSLLGSFWKRGYWLYTLTYVASNSFNAGFNIPGNVLTDGRQSGNTAKTMTPTHVGLAWSNWGMSPGVPEVDFGPIFRIA